MVHPNKDWACTLHIVSPDIVSRSGMSISALHFTEISWAEFPAAQHGKMYRSVFLGMIRHFFVFGAKD